jgi:hypothetical protein
MSVKYRNKKNNEWSEVESARWLAYPDDITGNSATSLRIILLPIFATLKRDLERTMP